MLNGYKTMERSHDYQRYYGYRRCYYGSKYADAIVVSNHGGHQLDGSPSSISFLEEIINTVNSKLEVLIDSVEFVVVKIYSKQKL